MAVGRAVPRPPVRSRPVRRGAGATRPGAPADPTSQGHPRTSEGSQRLRRPGRACEVVPIVAGIWPGGDPHRPSRAACDPRSRSHTWRSGGGCGDHLCDLGGCRAVRSTGGPTSQGIPGPRLQGRAGGGGQPGPPRPLAGRGRAPVRGRAACDPRPRSHRWRSAGGCSSHLCDLGRCHGAWCAGGRPTSQGIPGPRRASRTAQDLQRGEVAANPARSCRWWRASGRTGAAPARAERRVTHGRGRTHGGRPGGAAAICAISAGATRPGCHAARCAGGPDVAGHPGPRSAPDYRAGPPGVAGHPGVAGIADLAGPVAPARSRQGLRRRGRRVRPPNPHRLRGVGCG